MFNLLTSEVGLTIVGPLGDAQVIFGDLHGQLFNLFGHLLRVRKQLKAELKAKDTSWFKARPVTTSIPFAGFCRA